MKIFNDLLTLSATDLSSTITTSAVQVWQTQFTAFQIKVSAATGLSGTFNIQASLDEVQHPSDIVNWVTVDSQSVSSLGAAIVYMKSQTDNAYNYMRVTWTPSAGSGTLAEVRIMGKSY